MRSFYLVLMLFFYSSLFASEQPFTVDYALTISLDSYNTDTKSITTVLMSNKVFEMPGRKEDVHIGSIDILLTPISENEILVNNTFIVEGKEYTPSMQVALGEEASFTTENISLFITVSPYVPDVTN